MRSRTELVTTTFIDSEEDESESDDSEEDWKPDSTNRPNGGGTTKKRKPKSNRLKRKSINLTNKSPPSSSSSFSPSFKRQKFETATFKEEPDSDDGSYDAGSGGSNANYCQQPQQQYFPITTNQITARLNVLKDGKPLSQKVVAEQSMPDERGIFQLYLYKKDLDRDYQTNSNLCLWRRDGSSLLQKYIRIKTNNTEDFIFTSSSVYSSWDERRRKDFAILAVKCLEENNRRVTILDISDLHSLAEDAIRKKELKTENYEDDDNDDDSSNEMNENSQGDIYDEEDEDEYGYNESDNINDDNSSTDVKDDNVDEEENENDFEEQQQEEDNDNDDDDGDDEDDDDNNSGNDYSYSAKIVKDYNEENNDKGNINDDNNANQSIDINPKTP